METCLGIGPSRAGLQSATRSQRRTSFERAVGIGPTYENVADFRRTLRPYSREWPSLLAPPKQVLSRPPELVSGVEPDCSPYQGLLLPKTNQHLWTHGLTLPIVLLAKQNSDPSRLSPNVSRGAGESNTILLIWNQLGHQGPRPEILRLVPVTLRSPPLDRRVPTLAGSRGIRGPGWSRTSTPPFRK
jgi:hypothetical protein